MDKVLDLVSRLGQTWEIPRVLADCAIPASRTTFLGVSVVGRVDCGRECTQAHLHADFEQQGAQNQVKALHMRDTGRCAILAASVHRRSIARANWPL